MQWKTENNGKLEQKYYKSMCSEKHKIRMKKKKNSDYISVSDNYYRDQGNQNALHWWRDSTEEQQIQVEAGKEFC